MIHHFLQRFLTRAPRLALATTLAAVPNAHADSPLLVGDPNPDRVGASRVGRGGPGVGVTFTGNSPMDSVDASPGDGLCARAAGECTLRAAPSGPTPCSRAARP